MNSNNATATNKKISELYGLIKGGSLVLQPAFQRKFVWNTKHQKTFIDTVLRQLPFPEIYIADAGVNLETISSQEVVVDGQQRLSTLVQYIDGTLPIGKKDVIPSFADLDPSERAKLLNYKVVVRQLENVDTSTIREIFRRINLTRYALNAYEIQHAIYDGEFIGVAKRLSENEDFQAIPTFSESDSSRMQDLGFILLVMATIENQGYFSGDKEIERYIKEFDSSYPNKATLFKELLKITKVILDMNLPPDSTWYRKSNLFTLFVELSFHQSELTSKSLAKRLSEFEKEIQLNKNAEKENDYSRYYSYMFTGTNSRQARVERSVLFRKYILNLQSTSDSTAEHFA